MLFHQLTQAARQAAHAHGLRLCEFTFGAVLTHVRVTNGTRTASGVCLTPAGEGYPAPIRTDSLEAIWEEGRKFDVYRRALALAAANAVGQWQRASTPWSGPTGMRDLLLRHLLEDSTPDTAIVFIGHLRPVVAGLRAAGRNPLVFCRADKDPEQGMYNDIFEYEGLAGAEIVIMTGAALIGSTADAVIGASAKARHRYAVGFSAGANPEWFRGSGITHVASPLLADLPREIPARNDLEALFDFPAYCEEVSQD